LRQLPGHLMQHRRLVERAADEQDGFRTHALQHEGGPPRRRGIAATFLRRRVITASRRFDAGASERHEARPMANLAMANVMHRKTRTAVSVLGVALQVSTVMLLVGLANGTLAAIGERLQSVGADVILQPPDASLILGATQAVMPERFSALIRALPEVREVTP